MHPLKDNIPSGHRKFAVQYQFRRTRHHLNLLLHINQHLRAPRVILIFSLPLPFSLHSICTYPRASSPAPPLAGSELPLPASLPSRTGGEPCSSLPTPAAEPCFLPPPPQSSGLRRAGSPSVAPCGISVRGALLPPSPHGAAARKETPMRVEVGRR
jgi:hypothetical protein